MAWTHGVVVTASVAAGALFVQVGLLLLRRAPQAHVPAESRHALLALGVWWLGIGLTTALNAGLVWAGVAGHVTAALVARSVGLAAAGAAMWGIIAYLTYVRTGRSTASVPTAWAYGVLLAGTLWYIWSVEPTLSVGDWTVDLRGARTTLGSIVDVVLTLAFLLPPVVVGVLFLGLLRRSHEAAQRRRILTVGLGIPAWVLLHLLARLSMADAWQFLTRVVVGVAVALAVVAAYATGPRPGTRTGDAEGLAARVRELV